MAARGTQRDRVIAACEAEPAAVEDYPFGDDVAVFKVAGKMFALVMLNATPGNIGLKCDPEMAIELRARHPAITEGYHLNKRHWVSVELDDSVPDEELHDLVDQSYDLVVSKLTRAQRADLPPRA